MGKYAGRYGGEHFLLYFRAFDGACPVGLLSGAAARRRSGCAFGTVFYASSEKRREESGAALYGHGPGDGRGKRQFAIGFYYGFEKLIKNVGLEGLKLSDWGLRKDDAEKLAENSFAAMGALYLLDPVELTREDACAIISEAIQ